jgi:transcriptional regulator with XRE-family HTH domain
MPIQKGGAYVGVKVSVTPSQCGAARGLLDWSQIELAERSNLSESTIRDFEKGRRTPSQSSLDIIQHMVQQFHMTFTVTEFASGLVAP